MDPKTPTDALIIDGMEVDEKKTLSSMQEELFRFSEDLHHRFGALQDNFNVFEKDIREKAEKVIAERKIDLCDQVEAIKSLKNKKDSELKTAIENSKKKIEELEGLYRGKLRLEAPVVYWKKRAQSFRIRGYCWLGLGILASILLIKYLVSILYDFPAIFISAGQSLNSISIRSSLILLASAAVGAYMIRSFSRLSFSAFHIARDAEEREILTYVYLALREKQETTKEQEAVMLQSLFSRAETGLL
jgi:hypothetical protein